MTHTIEVGDCIEVMRGMAAGSVQCVVTSPPYWGLRDYGTAEWEGGDAGCDHIKGNARNDADNDFRPGRAEPRKIQYSGTCPKCGAKRIDRQIGLEETPDAYLSKMVAVFREVRRVLRDDGTLWLNLGSSYASSRLDPSGSACGNDGKGWQDSTTTDSACFRPDDGRRDLSSSGTAHNGPQPRESSGLRDTKDRDTLRPDCGSRVVGGEPRIAPASTTCESSQQPPGGCSQDDSRPASSGRSDGCSLPPGALASERTEPNNPDTSSTLRPSGDRTSDMEPSALAYLYYAMRSLKVKPKDMIPMPFWLALALQADGWYLRSDIIWHKPNPMPESCRDRPTKSHEYLFLLTKRATYYYDADAIREPHTSGTNRCEPPTGDFNTRRAAGEKTDGEWTRTKCPSRMPGYFGHPAGRNKRTVWTIPTEAFAEAHFATYPRALVKPCILAGTSDKGCCPECGAGWRRVVEREQLKRERPNRYVKRDGTPGTGNYIDQTIAGVSSRTVGWKPGCSCDAGDPVPCVVFDPFLGAGTTLVVAKQLGRDGIGCELNPEYAEMARKRIENPEPEPIEPDVPGQEVMDFA